MENINYSLTDGSIVDGTLQIEGDGSGATEKPGFVDKNSFALGETAGGVMIDLGVRPEDIQ